MIRRAYHVLIHGLAGFAGALIGALCLLIAWDVIARNLGLQPPASTVALTEYALLYFTMAAAPYLVRMRGHIIVEVLYRRVDAQKRRWLDRAVLTLCVVICALMATLAMLLAVEAWHRGEVDVRSLDTPRWLLFLPLVVGFGLMGTEFLRLLVRGESLAGAQRPDTF
ncbi:MAG: TRAP transporter small permease subunit [Chromatiales bacterium]|nr:MAG: TRAP transporter small permease subunit [Chromatiales bacterium]